MNLSRPARSSKLILLVIVTVFVMMKHAHAAQAPESSPIFAQRVDKSQTPKERAQTIEKIKNLREITGLEWFQMSVGDKEDHIFAAMYRLERAGTTFARTADEYAYLIQKKLYADPGLYEVNLTDILSAIVQEKGESHGQNIR